MTRFLASLTMVCLAAVLGCEEQQPALSCADGPDKVEMSLAFDEDKLSEYNITKGTVNDSLAQKFRLSMGMNIMDLRQLDSVVVGTHNGKPVLLVDVAEMKLAYYRRGEPWGAASDSASSTP